ncbi:hypothetical protein Mapa_008835 [Marchantia paleacea]|nr:hypothetical protein Mapa_008835 [Marchantia paleacea]
MAKNEKVRALVAGRFIRKLEYSFKRLAFVHRHTSCTWRTNTPAKEQEEEEATERDAVKDDVKPERMEERFKTPVGCGSNPTRMTGATHRHAMAFSVLHGNLQNLPTVRRLLNVGRVHLSLWPLLYLNSFPSPAPCRHSH